MNISIIGAGGLGIPAAIGILQSWPKEKELKLSIIDPDKVELSNLNRQVLFGVNDVEKPKAPLLCERLLKFCQLENSKYLSLRPIIARLDQNNIAEMLSESDIALDCCDSVETKFLINDFCINSAITFCYGGAVGTSGQIMLHSPFAFAPNNSGGCLRCLFGDWNSQDIAALNESCHSAGILGPVAGHIGLMQAQAVMDFLNGNKNEKIVLKRFSYPSLETKITTVFAVEACPNNCKNRVIKTFDLKDKRCPETFIFSKLIVEKLKHETEFAQILLSEKNRTNQTIESLRRENFFARSNSMDNNSIICGR